MTLEEVEAEGSGDVESDLLGIGELARASGDPAHPRLHGVLLDAAEPTLHAVATDRYRLAVAAAPVTGSGRAVLPVALVDEVRGLLAGAAGDAVVAVAGGSVEVTAAGRTVRGPAGDDFPDWRALEPAPGRHRVELTAADLRAAVTAGPAIRQERDGVPYDAVVLTLGTDGELTVAGAGDALEVAVNRDFLLDAVGHTGQLVLELDGPVTPLALRVPGRPDWSLLMPVRLPVAAS